MFEFFELLADFFNRIFALLNYFTVDIGGVEISILAILLACAFFAFVCSAFWRGAKK